MLLPFIYIFYYYAFIENNNLATKYQFKEKDDQEDDDLKEEDDQEDDDLKEEDDQEYDNLKEEDDQEYDDLKEEKNAMYHVILSLLAAAAWSHQLQQVATDSGILPDDFYELLQVFLCLLRLRQIPYRG